MPRRGAGTEPTKSPSIALVRGKATDRAAVMRVRAAPGTRHFVHYNWFWLDRSLADRAIRFRLIRRGPRNGVAGVIAYGPHETVDLDPSSRRDDIGEIYHVVIGENFAGRNIGLSAVRAAAGELRVLYPAMRALRVGHNPDNAGAAGFFKRLGFKRIGEKADGETGTHDVLLEIRGPALCRLIDGELRSALRSPLLAS